MNEPGSIREMKNVQMSRNVYHSMHNKHNRWNLADVNGQLGRDEPYVVVAIEDSSNSNNGIRSFLMISADYVGWMYLDGC